MFDIKWIRVNAEAFDLAMKRRGVAVRSSEVLTLDDARRHTITALNELQGQRNAASKLIGQAKGQGDETRAQELMAEVSDLKTQLQQKEEGQRKGGSVCRVRPWAAPRQSIVPAFWVAL